MSTRWYRYLVLLSLLSLGIYLYKADYLVAVDVRSPGLLALSAMFLLAGFLGQAASWWATINQSEYKASFAICAAGVGLSIFTGYIPGKVFVVLGRAVYLAEHMAYPRARVSVVSLSAQLVALWSGLTLGSLGLLLAGDKLLAAGPIAATWVVFTLVIFSDVAHRMAERLVRGILGWELSLPRLRFRSVARVLPWFFMTWLLWSAGLFCLLRGVLEIDVPLAAGLGFPLATTLGIVAIFAPSGLGVREGALAAFLLAVGFSGAEALSASVYARLWFLAGEIVMFGIGVLANRIVKRSAGEWAPPQ